ncbi:EAL domain-containing protein [Pseudomonas sp.]|uniref:sensor domain-containing phosphodiesterase n=1 Tax=Pseudomonas sp. TaxID=306 RepID=UPI002589D9F4|nr:EAL domain-containing protein [Pseudomonas sp.]
MDMSADQLASVVTLKTAAPTGTGCIDKVLRALRTHLGMDVAFVSQFRTTDRVFVNVDTDGDGPIKPGDCLSLDVGYCLRVVEGVLPELIADTAHYPVAMELPETQALPIGSHLSVPIYLSDGRLYGTFCCFGYSADDSLNQRDLLVMKVFAELIADRIEGDLTQVRDRVAKHRRISAVLASNQPAIVYQPIFDFHGMAICGWECLSRFNVEPLRSPDQWFNEAADAGLGVELECHAIAAALRGMDALPSGTYLTINCSPQLLLSGRLTELLGPCPASRLVLEITEHAVVSDYTGLIKALKPLRQNGVRVAIDDAGAGYASMRHILQLRPDMIKLDMSLTQNIDTDPQKRAMASALIAFARETGSTIVAEGVETQSELDALRLLGANKVQGYLLGRPLALPDALALVERVAVNSLEEAQPRVTSG